MKKNIKYYLFFSIFITFIFCIFIYLYSSYSGSCYNNNHISKNCNNKFCLIKKINLDLPNSYKNRLFDLINNDKFKKRVEINNNNKLTSLFNCAIPSKSGSIITTSIINKEFPEFINYYQTELCNIISNEINIKLKPTPLNYQTSCCILIYEKEGDWINWHYDYNYYKGRFFTVLIPLTNKKTCTKFQYKINNEIKQVDLVDESIIFEGDFLYHNASKICKNELRCILSLQYVTDDEINYFNKMRIKIKDIAYTGFL